ncbi:MAG: MmgE/PrpD family protein [Acidimicrobiales bacterium]
MEFVLDLDYSDLEAETRSFARRCLLDIVGVAAAGSTTELSRIIGDHAAAQFGAGRAGASLWFDGRVVSPAGAALAGAMTIDSVDAHDGHKLTKGHVGCGVVPAALALIEAGAVDDAAELLTMLVIGYEIGTRAGIALHRTAADYHTSGAWVALACAALGARTLGLSASATREAIGIAEYHGPRSPMMRVIDHPTMLKDGSGWGAMAGVSAAYLAADGFTGAPAGTLEAPDVADLWGDLGSRWRIFEQYFKPYPVCRWAQPAVEAALTLCRDHDLEADDIDHLEIVTFHEARRLATAAPVTTEQAQYSLPFAVAAAVARGRLGVDEVSDAALADPEILRLSTTARITERADFNASFPERRFAEVTIVGRDATTVSSPATEARGDPEAHLSQGEIVHKFEGLAKPVLGDERTEAIRAAVDGLDDGADVARLRALLTEPTSQRGSL